MRNHVIQKILYRASATLALGALILTIARPHQAAAAPAIIFCNGNMGTPSGLTTSQINGFRASGMNTMVIFTMTVQANGDFTYGGYTLCSGGNYVGPANYASLLNQCKAAPSSVTRIEMCIGGWGDPSFANIKNIIAAQGNNTGNVIYRNLGALHGALPIDAIDYDDESTYDSSSAVTFGGMAASLGMKVTLCPYTNPGYWQAVKSGLGNYCDAVYLQCYEGGAGNDPATWDGYFGGFKVMPGYWDYERDTTLLTKMQSWASASSGGFLWPSCTGCNPPADGNEMLQNANWIHQAMDVGPVYFAIVNQNSQKPLDVQWGTSGNGVQIWQYSYNGTASQLWSLVPVANNTHFAIVSALTGECVSVAGDSTAPQAIIWDWAYNNDPSQQWDLIDVGNGLFNIRNVRSGLVLDVAGSSTADQATVQQYGANGTAAQQFRFQPIGNYYLQPLCSGKYVATTAAVNGGSIIQTTFAAQSAFQWNFNYNSASWNGWYAVASVWSGRVISVIGSSTQQGAGFQLFDFNPNNIGDQFVRIYPRLNGSYSFYYKHDGFSWDIPGATTADAALDQWPNNDTAAQEFNMLRIK